MGPNPALGVLFHWLGGLASGSFYVPFRKVKFWSWETYWLAGGVFSWILAPLLAAGLLTNHLGAVLTTASPGTLLWCFVFGLLWGVGGLTFGLTMRYLGLSLGMAIVMGLCAAFGTLMPPIVDGSFSRRVLHTHSGQVILGGIALCLAGISICGLAGVFKERSSSAHAKATSSPQAEAIREFHLTKGFLVAFISGVMSACFAYGLAAGAPIRALTLRAGTSPLWQGLPVLVIVLLGGFATNFLWVLYLNIRNGSGREYLARTLSAVDQNSSRAEGNVNDSSYPTASASMATTVLVAQSAVQTSTAANIRKVKVPLVSNYLFCALAGITWYLQFFFYTMGETKMGAYNFSSWTLHMASIVLFSSLWGIGLHEWKGAGTGAKSLLLAGLLVLLGSTVVVGYGNYLAAKSF